MRWSPITPSACSVTSAASGPTTRSPASRRLPSWRPIAPARTGGNNCRDFPSPPSPPAPSAAGGGGRAGPMFELVARAEAGNRAALDELLVRCLPSLRRWAHGRLPSAARGALDTEDLVQQAAFQTLRRLHLFQPHHVYS